MSALAGCSEGPARSALAWSALEPLVRFIAAFSWGAAASHPALIAVAEAAQLLVTFVEEEEKEERERGGVEAGGARATGAAGPVAAAAGEAAGVEGEAAAAHRTLRAELRSQHLPALRAAARCRQLDSPLPSLLHLLQLLDADVYVLLHLPPADLAARLGSCLQCWRAQPRRACSHATEQGEQLHCAICCSEEEGGAGMLALHCGHLFHRRCLMA